MQTNPFITSVVNRVAGISATVVAWTVLSLLLWFYGKEELGVSCLDGLVSVGLLATAGFLYGFIEDTIPGFQVRVLLVVLVQGISLAGAYELQVWLVRESFAGFAGSIPLRLTFGILCWIILVQWYRVNRIELSQEEDFIGAEEMLPEDTAASSGPALDRVSVKDGTRIHIIHLDELLYLQSGGDYVTLFTPSGQFVKEQTMKYFEAHLPPALFVRIHRCCIVNTEQILRVELFGKENYQIRLKNGVSLRASSSGYKLLKERLIL